MSQTGMQAFAGKINLTLLNDIIAFVREASDADNARKQAVQQECIFLYGNTGGGALQEKYGALRDFKTVQAYRFYQKFMGELGAQKLNILFDNDTYGDLYSSLVNEGTGYHGVNEGITFSIGKDFLDDDGRRQVLEWLEAYIFLQKPER